MFGSILRSQIAGSSCQFAKNVPGRILPFDIQEMGIVHLLDGADHLLWLRHIGFAVDILSPDLVQDVDVTFGPERDGLRHAMGWIEGGHDLGVQ